MVELREVQRVEDKELEDLQKEVEGAVVEDTRGEKVDINKADKDKLQRVNGIGPALADRIIEGRPYKSVDELVKVKGISKRSLEKIRPYLSVGP